MHCVGTSGPVSGLLHRLHQEAAKKVQLAYAPKSKGTLGSAIQAFARFAAACPERLLFKESRWKGETAAAAWNEWSFILFAEYLSVQPSAKTKQPISVKSIETYISLLKGFFKHTYDFEIPEGSPRLSRLVKMMREEQPMAGSRRKRRGLRRRHLKQMWETVPAARGTSANEVNEQAPPDDGMANPSEGRRASASSQGVE